MSTINTMWSQQHKQAASNATLSLPEFADIRFGFWFSVLVRMIVAKARLRRSRHHLKELPLHLLNDIGVTRHEAEQEIRKSFPFWYFDNNR